jgi:hypothetical protein
MVQFSGIFSPVLEIFSRSDFERAVESRRTRRTGPSMAMIAGRSLLRWLFCQVGRAHNLREICGSLPARRESSIIWVLAMLPPIRPFPMPMRIARSC